MRPAKPETPNRRRRAHHRRGAVPTRFSCIAKYPNPTQVGVHAVSAHSSNGRPAWPTRIRGEISVPELSWLLRVLEHIQKTQIEVGPTNKDFYMYNMYMYRAHKFKPTGLAPHRAEYGIWRKNM